MATQFTAVFFDLDGTLADTVPVCIQAFQNTIRKHLNRALSDREVQQMFGPSEEGMLRSLMNNRWQQGAVSIAAAWSPGVNPAILERSYPGFLFHTVAAFSEWLFS